ncbi:MAG: helix-turn-helix domain-containing protein, partial [Oscillospiraceae bacterium]
LFYRLSTAMIFVPSLRERGHDLDLLIQHFIDKSNSELNLFIERMSHSLRSLLQSYYWPGNIRELSNTIESAMNLTLEGESILDVHHLPAYLKTHFKEEISAMPNAMQVFAHTDYTSHRMKNYEQYPVMDFHGNLSDMVGEYEKNILEIALASTNGNLTRCGEKMGITRQGLMKKVKKYQIDLKKYKPTK